MIVNLTPHPLRIYPLDCPDRIEENTLGTWFSDSFAGGGTVHVEGVEYGLISGLPLPDTEATDVNLPPRTRYVVPLVVALAARGRSDLLVPYRDVRSLTGTVLGCRQLAQPC